MKDNKGFTLIELLAVITIMGILMMVAIPTVSRTIENSRKDTFIDTAKKYTDSVKTMWAGDNLYCPTSDGGNFNSSAVPSGTYYVKIDTTDSSVPVLLEQGGKSSWGSRDIKGYVKIVIDEKKGLYGDANQDGSLSSADAVRTLQFISGAATASEFQKKLVDLNFDGVITDEDASLVLKLNDGHKIDGLNSSMYVERNMYFYPTISDGIHGINLSDSADETESDELVRGNLVMTGASYDKAAVPATALLCVER